MDALAEKYVREIEGHVPDLNDLGGADDDEDGLRDSIYDHACDYIYDREPHDEPGQLDAIRLAAKQISEHFCGQEEA
jgi:hypothetical protein